LLELLQPSRINQATRINEPRTPSENPRCAICLTPCFKRRCGERITFSPVLSQNLLQLRREPVQAQGGVVHLVLDVHPPDGYGLCCRRPAHPRFGTPLRRFAFARFGAAPLDFHRTPPRGPRPPPLFQRPCLVSIVRRNAILPSPNRIRKNADNRDSVNHTSQRRFPDVMPDDLPGCLATVCVLHLAWLRHSITNAWPWVEGGSGSSGRQAFTCTNEMSACTPYLQLHPYTRRGRARAHRSCGSTSAIAMPVLRPHRMKYWISRSLSCLVFYA